MIKIFTVYYDRYETATTSEALKDYSHTVLCHTGKERFQNVYGDIIETGNPKGVQHQFNYILDTLSTGDWAIILSDDYICTKSLVNGKFQKTNISEAVGALQREIKNVKGSNIHLIGLGLTANAFYVKQKYGYKGLVDARMFAIKKGSFRFDENISTIPDYEATLWHLRKYGMNLVVKDVVAEFGRYKKGGLGSVSDRIEQKIRDCKTLVDRYSPVCRYAPKKGQPKYSHVRIYAR